MLTSNHATIGELAEQSEQWRMFTLAYISVAISKYLDFLGRRNTMDDYQVAETATLILEEYPDLKVDDIALFFRQCRLSRFGKLYDLNGAVLLDWLNDYTKQRNAAQYDLYKRQEQQRKDEEERRRQAEWEALTPEQQAEQQRKIEEIQERIRQKLSGALPYKHHHRLTSLPPPTHLPVTSHTQIAP